MDVVVWLLVFLAVFLVGWLLNFLLAALAFRINLGSQPMPLEAGEFWLRSGLAGLGLTGYVAVAFLLAFIVALARDQDTAEVRLGDPVLLVLLVPYPVAAVFLLNWAFALDDLLEGFKVFLIHHLLPGSVLLVLSLLFGTFWDLLRRVLIGTS
jgi:hypothetical protein